MATFLFCVTIKHRDVTIFEIGTKLPWFTFSYNILQFNNTCMDNRFNYYFISFELPSLFGKIYIGSTPTSCNITCHSYL